LNSDSPTTAFSPEQVQCLYDQHAAALNSFLVGVLRNHAAAADVLQSTFAKLLERGHTIAGADKGNDFRLSQSMHRAIQQENTEQVKAALLELPDPLQEVIRKRIYEGLKFKDIASELNIPLGTALARAQLAYKKLEPLLRQVNED